MSSVSLGGSRQADRTFGLSGQKMLFDPLFKGTPNSKNLHQRPILLFACRENVD